MWSDVALARVRKSAPTERTPHYCSIVTPGLSKLYPITDAFESVGLAKNVTPVLLPLLEKLITLELDRELLIGDISRCLYIKVINKCQFVITTTNNNITLRHYCLIASKQNAPYRNNRQFLYFIKTHRVNTVCQISMHQLSTVGFGEWGVTAGPQAPVTYFRATCYHPMYIVQCSRPFENFNRPI